MKESETMKIFKSVLSELHSLIHGVVGQSE